MKNKYITWVLVLVLTFITSLYCSAVVPPIIDLPHTFSSTSTMGSIDIDEDGNGDFYVIYQGLIGGYNFKIYGVLSCYLMAEYIPPTSQPPAGAPAPLTALLSNYASVLPYGTEILFSGLASPLASTPVGPFWTEWAYIVQRATGLPPIAPLGTTAQQGAFDGYIGVNFENASGHYNGWIHIVVDDLLPQVTVLSAGMGSAPGAAVPAGLGDPYASTVPVPLIASLLGIIVIGSGIVIRKRKKK
ncbi:MAG: hypothetical protein JW798_03485 [Prolixibacteraceae bacterium]|nr:hypothetical protein [Prolixibacteraceae bacterium]